MILVKLSFHNFKKSFQNYFSMILSLAFTVMIIFNFINLLYTDTFTSLAQKEGYIESVVNVLEVVLWCFTFFFIWYASNVFLMKRKKEIGIYVFMGLTNQRIGRLYMLEMTMIGIAALVLGVCGGLITTHLFQMILLAISEITVDISFQFAWKPVIITSIIYIVMYLIFTVKGYVNIVRSSVLDMISAARQNEYVRTKTYILFFKMVIGIAALANGYYLATKDGGMETINNLFIATVFVIIGTYFIFGGFLPFMFQYLAGKKSFLYSRERNLWINNVIFRMRKNYRTYAMTCVLITCAVTALAASFAAKGQYDNMVNFRNTYTYQILTNRSDIGEEADELIKMDNDIDYRTEISFLQFDKSHFSDGYAYGILAFSEVKKLAEVDEVICMSYGADDFIAKPYNPAILLLHIEAIFKRLHHGTEETVVTYKRIRLDVARGSMEILDESGQVREGNHLVELTKNEMRILLYLIKNKGKIVARDELISYLWDSEEFVDDNTLTVNINRVRGKLKEHGVEDFIKTKRGIGYLLA